MSPFCFHFPLIRLWEPAETGPDGELRGPPEQCGVPETQHPPPRAVSGGESLHAVRGLQAVCGGCTASAQGNVWGGSSSTSREVEAAVICLGLLMIETAELHLEDSDDKVFDEKVSAGIQLVGC